MIGASFPATSVPVAVAAPEHAAATGDAGTATRTDGGAATANGASKGASPAKEGGGRDTAVNAAARREDAAQDRRAGDDASPRDFAELLAASDTTITGTATKPVATEPGATEPPAPATLPDQLLALLSGNWATANAPAPASAAPASPGTAGNTSAAAPQPSTAAATGTPPLVLPKAAAADAGGENFAALAKLATDALGANDGSADKPGVQGADAPSPADGFLPGTVAPVAPPVRAGVLAPTVALAMPADPDAGFDDGFGARIAWMAEQRVGHAEIRLNPEHVGPIDVRVQLDGNRVSAEFHSAHADVRHAIESSMPRLREMLGQHGLQLGHADVGQRQAQGSRSHGGAVDAGADRDGDDGAPLPSLAPLRSRGLLDEYA